MVTPALLKYREVTDLVFREKCIAHARKQHHGHQDRNDRIEFNGHLDGSGKRRISNERGGIDT